ncbi:MAG: carbohydrate kinase family protein [Lachnospiraceae bacterium]|nr:carbohydrate kinase family protein [Candidatus Equihabitans merdae]
MILCSGTAMIDCIMTKMGTEAVADDIGIFPGGEAFNEAVILARLGEEVLFSAPIGQDTAGQALMGILEKEHVSLAENDYTGRTPVSLLVTDETGNRKSRVSKIHQLAGYEAAVPENMAISYATMASLFRPPFLNPADCLTYAKKVKAAGGVILADTKMPKGTDPKLEDYAKTLALLDFITPNETEAAYYTGKSNPEEAAEVFKSYGVKNVIIKHSDRGAYCLDENGEGFWTPSYKVTCLDGIGAGDNFNAGLLHALHTGATLKEALRFATACGALCVMERGAIDGVRSAEQVEQFLKERA